MLRIAKILKSNGIDGALLISAPEYDFIDFTEPVLIEFDGLPVPFFVEECTRRGQNKYIIKITDVCSLKDAEELVGKDIFMDAIEEDDSQQMFDFCGWVVFDGAVRVGEVEYLDDIPGNPCLSVKREAISIMIPLHEDFIINIDSQNKELYLKLPKGLY